MAGGRPTQKQRSALGTRIVEARQKLGWSQRQLADKLSLSQRALAHWETNPVALRAEQLAALADALEVSADYLLGREEKRASKTGLVGKARRVFDEISALPRDRQEKIADFVAVYVQGYQKNKTN